MNLFWSQLTVEAQTMARRGFDYQTWGSGILLGFVLGCLATFTYLQIGGACEVH